MNNNNQISFTLIELLVVIAIIGILAGIAIPAFQGATERAQIAKGLQFSDSLRNSLMINLISEWKFDDYLTNPSSTTAKDSWAKYNANTGTLVYFNFTDPNSGWRTGSNCVSGSCLSFDGVNDYVDCGNDPSLNITDAITIEAWVKPAQNITHATVLAKEHFTNNLGYLFHQLAGTSWMFRLYYEGAYFNLSVSNSVALNEWQQIIATYDGTIMRLYKNGMQIGTLIGPSRIATTTEPLWIGGRSKAGQYFSGLIDEVRIYNAALPQAMIQQHYVQGLNSMLANKSISYEEYSQRMSEISSNLAIK